MKITETTIFSEKIRKNVTLVVASDLHNRPYDAVLSHIKRIKPNYILIPGDLTDNLDKENFLESCSYGLSFLSETAKIATTVYSVGNHERRIGSQCRSFIKETGAILLDDETISLDEITFGGLSTGLFESKYGPTPPPSLDYLEAFAQEEGFKLLLCHHPEYYPQYIRSTEIDLTVSGHAHGGQWRLFGRGVYAPGQGLFPKYTSGLYENRLYVSRGLANTCHPIPRFFNPTELAVIYLKANKKDA